MAQVRDKGGRFGPGRKKKKTGGRKPGSRNKNTIRDELAAIRDRSRLSLVRTVDKLLQGGAVHDRKAAATLEGQVAARAVKDALAGDSKARAWIFETVLGAYVREALQTEAVKRLAVFEELAERSEDLGMEGLLEWTLRTGPLFCDSLQAASVFREHLEKYAALVRQAEEVRVSREVAFTMAEATEFMDATFDAMSNTLQGDGDRVAAFRRNLISIMSERLPGMLPPGETA